MLYSERFRGFKQHPHLEGSHAFLSPSKYHWVNYPREKLIDSLRTAEAAAKGTRLHAWAAEAIELGRRQPENYDTLSDYVNDAIDMDLVPEQTLFYSFNCYGTADTIGFEQYTAHPRFAGFLRVHDLKTGRSPTSPKQLYVYAAIFCHEYEFRPYEIDGELRIYQGDEIRAYELDHDVLARIYDAISSSDQIVEEERRARRARRMGVML